MIWLWIIGIALLFLGIAHGMIGMIAIGAALTWFGMLGCHS
jgi:hypothetical protein